MRLSQLFIIAPAYNEAGSLSEFAQAIGHVQQQSFPHLPTHLLIVDDGSSDTSEEVIHQLVESIPLRSIQIVGVHLTRNFGHQAAIHAGLTVAFSKAPPDSCFIVMDSDLQHPPELLPKILDSLEKGSEHVQMIRQSSDSEGTFTKRAMSRFFYSVFRQLSDLPMPPGSSDFRGLSYSMADSFLKLPEVDRFNRGLFWWVGSAPTEIHYKAAERHEGRSKYSWFRMMMLAGTGITSFSSAPLIIVLVSSSLFAFIFCVLYFLYECYGLFIAKRHFSIGWPSIIFLITFWGGLLSLGQLLMGIYMSKIFKESKGRPSFIIRSISNRRIPFHDKTTPFT